MHYTNSRLLSILLLLCTLYSSHAQQLWHEPAGEFTPLWQQFTPSNKQSIRVLHIGDSHLSGGYMTAPIRERLESLAGPKLQMERICIPGATFSTFSTDSYMARVRATMPQLIIVSLGTNDSYTYSFSPVQMEQNVDNFFSMLQSATPEALIVVTTPPPSYLKRSIRLGNKRVTTRTRRGKRVTRYVPNYSVQLTFNPNTTKASQILKLYAERNGFALYDLTKQIGTETTCQTWLREGLMNSDHVHYTRQGYHKIGSYIADALYNTITRNK